MEYKIISITDVPWEQIDASKEASVFHTIAWNKYIDSIGYKPIIISITDNNCPIALFVGQILWRGVKIVASPWYGIGTYTQGLIPFKPISEDERISIYKECANWLHKNKGIRLFQVDDWGLKCIRTSWIPPKECSFDSLSRDGIIVTSRPTLFLDMSSSREQLWQQLHYNSCKYSINKARKGGLRSIQIVDYNRIPEFVEVHYSMLEDVCRGKGMHPKKSQSKLRMQKVCESLFPNNVLMIEVVGPDDAIMSSAIFCFSKGESVYWSGASYKCYQKYCPNELMVWDAISYLKDKGSGDLNFGGMADYKLKFGTKYAYVPRITICNSKLLVLMRDLFRKIYYRAHTMIN